MGMPSLHKFERSIPRSISPACSCVGGTQAEGAKELALTQTGRGTIRRAHWIAVIGIHRPDAAPRRHRRINAVAICRLRPNRRRSLCFSRGRNLRLSARCGLSSRGRRRCGSRLLRSILSPMPRSGLRGRGRHDQHSQGQSGRRPFFQHRISHRVTTLHDSSGLQKSSLLYASADRQALLHLIQPFLAKTGVWPGRGRV